jgi:APA family basic amino acid/polyamine antiporter
VPLLRVLGVGFGLAVTIGNTIGAGILRAPGEVAAHLPDTWLFLAAWIAGGTYALLGAIQISELGAMLPRSGGQYVFARHAFGDYAGFVVGWSDWLSVCGTTAAVSIVIAEFSGVLVAPLSGAVVPIATTVAVVFAFLQWRGIRWGSRIQNGTSLAKAVAFISLVAAAFILGGETGPSAPGPAPRRRGSRWRRRSSSRFRASSTPMTAGPGRSTSPKSSMTPDGVCLAPCSAACWR